MYMHSTAFMAAEEVLAQHEKDCEEETKRQAVRDELERFYAEREAGLKAAREAERIANLPLPDPIDLSAKEITRLLGDRFYPVIDAFIGSGDNANIVLRRLVKAAKEARIAKRRAELNAGAL